MYGHVKTLAEAELKGIKEAGGTADLYQIEETLPQEVLSKMHAPGQDNGVTILSDPKTLEQYDAFLFGIPTRYGNFPAQWKSFWDKTGGQWQSGAYWGKYGGVFISTGTQGGGQESTALAAMSTFAHHGIIYVPLGYKTTFQLLAGLDNVRGGSPWGAGTFAVRPRSDRLPIIMLTLLQGPTGARQPTEEELQLATLQGKAFYEAVAKAHP